MNRPLHWLVIGCVVLLLPGCGGGTSETSGSSKVSEIKTYLDAYDGLLSAVESAHDPASAKQAAGEIQARIRDMESSLSALGGDRSLTLTGLDAAFGARLTALERRLKMAMVRIDADPALAAALSGPLSRIPKLK